MECRLFFAEQAVGRGQKIRLRGLAQESSFNSTAGLSHRPSRGSIEPMTAAQTNVEASVSPSAVSPGTTYLLRQRGSPPEPFCEIAAALRRALSRRARQEEVG